MLDLSIDLLSSGDDFETLDSCAHTHFWFVDVRFFWFVVPRLKKQYDMFVTQLKAKKVQPHSSRVQYVRTQTN